ncbi:MAG: RraA family protein [Anaerolineae bacterium]|nr:RraA family protein [Anaerolineae bacterium]
MQEITPEVLEKLCSFDTPTICNLIELFDVRPRNTGYMGASIQACFPEMRPFIGYAATATFRSSGPTQEGDAYAGIAGQVERFGELSGPPVVVFQDLDDPVVAATFGEVMCTTYQAFGSVGLITSGAGRDLEQVREIGFPVFTGSTICAHGYCHIPQAHVPVHVGGLVVYPNDLLHGDLNGVTTVPKDIVVEMADVGDEFVGAERFVLDAMREGTPTVARLEEARAEMAEITAGLRAQVSRTR